MTPHLQRPTFLRLLSMAAPFKGSMALAVVLGALTVGSSIGLMAASAYIIARAAGHPSIAELAVPVVAVRFFGIARGGLRYLERLVSHHVNFSLLARLRVWLYTAIEPLAPAGLIQSSHHSGDLVSRFVGDIETLQNVYIRVIAPPLVAAVIAAGMAFYLYAFSPLLAILVLAFMFLAGVLLPFAAQRASREMSRRMVQVRSRLNIQLVDGVQGMADLLAFGRARAQADLIGQSSRELVRLQTRMATVAALDNAGGNLLAQLAMWSVLVIAIPLVVSAQMEGVWLPVLALAVLASFEAVLTLPQAFQYLEGNLQSARRLFDLVDRSNAVTVTSVPPGLPAELPREWSVRVEDLSFRYAPDEPLALERLSFDVRQGGHIAIVGPSGAGKSTIVNLLLRFWDLPNGNGRIWIGERELGDYAPETARQFFGVVSQTTYLFNTSIRENLRLARPNASETEILRAAEQAAVHEFICSLPQGYDTVVGEQGLKLSGGERQRLSIARTLLRDSPIVLLDEPTANLDPLTERAVLDTLQISLQKRTTLLITHRLYGLDKMDQILVLDGGRLVECGTLPELMQCNGLFRRMWDLQTLRFGATQDLMQLPGRGQASGTE